MSTLTMRLLRLATLTILLAGSLAAAGTTRGQELDGDTYADEEYGWSVAFDEDVWTGEEVDEPTYRGLNLSFEAGFGTLAVYDNGETDPAACLEATADDFSGSDVFLDFESSRTLDAPATDRDAEGEIFTTTYTADDTEIPLVFYIECREVDGGTLNVQLATNADVYEDSLPAFEELLAAIEIETGGSTRDDTPEPDDEETPEADKTPEPDDETPTRDGDVRENDPDAGELDGDTFTDTNFAYSVSWDDVIWEAELLEGGNAAGVLLVAEFATLVIDASTGYEGEDADECVASLAESFEGFDGYSSLTDEPRVDGPEPPRAGAGAVYSFTFTDEENEEFERVAYIECRPVDDESMIRVSIQTNEELLEDNVDAFQEVLDEIDVDAADETPEPNDPDTVENDIDAGELDGDTFTDTALGYTFTFDDRVWTAELLADSSTAAVFLVTDAEELFATVTVDASLGYVGVDVEQCVSDYADGVETIEGYSSLRAERTIDGLDPPRGSAGTVYSYTYTYEDDTTAELVAYVECRPISDEAMIRINVQTSEASLDANAAVFQELLDGIEID